MDVFESKFESSNNRMNVWGIVSFLLNGGLNLSILNLVSNYGVWLVLENNGFVLKGFVGSGSFGINI